MELSIDENDKLAALRPRYLERLRARICDLEKMSNEPAQAQGEMHRLAHSMGSSALLYGYDELGQAARNLEAVFDSNGGEPAQLRRHLETLIAAARRVAEVSGGTG